MGFSSSWSLHILHLILHLLLYLLLRNVWRANTICSLPFILHPLLHTLPHIREVAIEVRGDDETIAGGGGEDGSGYQS